MNEVESEDVELVRVQASAPADVQTPKQKRRTGLDRRETVKIVFLCGLITACFFCSQAIGSMLARIRGVVLELPLVACVVVFAVLMVLRRLFAPIWYLVPMGAIMVVTLVIKLGLLPGVLTFQALKVTDLFSCYLIKRLFNGCLGPEAEIRGASAAASSSSLSMAVPNNSSESNVSVRAQASDSVFQDDEGSKLPRVAPAQKLRWLLPEILVTAMSALDQEWGHRVLSAPPPKQALIVACFGVAWYVEEEAMLYWFCLRSSVSPLAFAAGLAAYTALNVPDMLVRARVFQAAFDALESSNAELVAIRDTPLLLLALVLVIAVPGTAFVHSTHLRLLWHSNVFERCTNEDTTDAHPSSVALEEMLEAPAAAVTAENDRTARRALLLEEQMIGIE